MPVTHSAGTSSAGVQGRSRLEKPQEVAQMLIFFFSFGGGGLFPLIVGLHQGWGGGGARPLSAFSSPPPCYRTILGFRGGYGARDPRFVNLPDVAGKKTPTHVHTKWVLSYPVQGFQRQQLASRCAGQESHQEPRRGSVSPPLGRGVSKVDCP